MEFEPDPEPRFAESVTPQEFVDAFNERLEPEDIDFLQQQINDEANPLELDGVIGYI